MFQWRHIISERVSKSCYDIIFWIFSAYWELMNLGENILVNFIRFSKVPLLLQITFSLLSTIGNFNPNHAQGLAWSCTKSWSGQYCLIQWKLFHMMKDSSYYLKKFFSFHAWAGFKMLIDLVLRRKCFLSYAPLVQASMSVKSNLGHHHEFTEEEACQIELITFNWICIKFGSLKKY